MSRIRLTIAYDGRAFEGWQSQLRGNTVQDCLESAILKVAGVSLRINGSGRTDTGVHALGQAAHFDPPPGNEMKAKDWERALNANLPTTIRIVSASLAPDGFHARFSAKSKTYRYEIDTGPVLYPLRVARALHHPENLNVEIMRLACSSYVGEHDFASFAANRRDGKEPNTIRIIRSAKVTKYNEGLAVTFCGNGFLYKMVRLLVGAAIRVAEGREEMLWLEEMLQSPGIAKCQYCATGEGLYLVEVAY